MENSDKNQPVRPEDYYNTVRVEDYYDKVHRSAWARHTAGTFAGATLGAVYGFAIGTVAAFLPYILGAMGIAGATVVGLPALTAILSSAALFSGVAAGVGMLSVAAVGGSAAAVAGGLEEMEKRNKLQNCEPPAVSVTTPSKEENPPQLFSWKVALATATLGALFGALIGFDPMTASKVALLGFPAASHAAIAASSAIFAMAAGLIGFKNSYITNKVSNFYFKLITEQYFSKNKEKELAVEPQPEKSSAPDFVVEESLAATKSFSDGKKRYSLSDLITRRQETGAQDITITR